MAKVIDKVTYRWQPKGGWYCGAYEGDRLVYDSRKKGFPVVAKEFNRDQEAELAKRLRAMFPGAEIE